jgi:hypothetical protein
MKGTFRRSFSGLLLGCVAITAVHGAPALRVSSIQSNGWVRIYGESESDGVMTLDASANLAHWKTIAVLHGSNFEFADPVSPQLPYRFYRLSVTPFTATNDWKNQISIGLLSRDQFFADQQWVKFAIVTNEPARVYYADSGRFLFHYNFATTRLEPLLGLSQAEFDARSLYNAGRQVLLGAVLAPGWPFKEYGVQFVGQDPLPRELVRDSFELVKSTVIAPELRTFYIPTFDQLRAVEADREWFEAHGIQVAPADRWTPNSTCYVGGWAIGTLKFFTASEISAAYADGRLLPQDILLTDGIPAELPYLAGVITLAPATPNSHAVILAQSYGVPFVYLLHQYERDRAMGLVGQEIALRILSADRPEDGCLVEIFALDATFDPAVKAQILALKAPPPVDITPMTPYGAYTASAENLVPADIRFFGGKAANFGLLRRTIPSNSPVAIAISFDLWNDFMAQVLPSGRTLRQEITNRLAGYTYPRDIGAIKTALDGIRRLIRQNTQFTANQQQAIIAALGIFDSDRNIRFRSSSNAEDSETFVAAGLYDSFSGCLADDLDGDNVGPSLCDPTEEDERGVFRAIRRVYASFYNDNAYLERLRRGIDENSVGMAMLVHHSTPDQFEMANGVATWSSFRLGSDFSGALVTQLGAPPVANPDVSAAPEVYWTCGGFRQYSSLVQIGENVMNWPSDYQMLISLLSTAGEGYRQMTGNEGYLLLDFEYKKVQPGVLRVKQVRKLPPPATNRVAAPFLINDSVILTPLQGVETGLWPTHRLKSRWALGTRNMWLTTSNLASTFLTHVTVEHLRSNRIETLSVPVQSLTNFSYSVSHSGDQSITTNSWRISTVDGPATIELEVSFSRAPMLPTESGILVGIRRASLTATYDQPVFSPGPDTNWRTTERIVLRPARDPYAIPTDQRFEHAATFNEGGTNVTVSVGGLYGVDSDNPWLLNTLETRIEGLTSEPIVLTNYYSQTVETYHNGAAHGYLFEPRLEPGISPTVLRELEALNIRWISFRSSDSFAGPGFGLGGFDGSFRPFGSVVGRTLSVTVTDSDSPPFPPSGSTYTVLFNNQISYTLTDDQGNVRTGGYRYERTGNRATLVRDPSSFRPITSTLTFESANSGTIHSEANDNGNLVTEHGTFTFSE